MTGAVLSSKQAEGEVDVRGERVQRDQDNQARIQHDVIGQTPEKRLSRYQSPLEGARTYLPSSGQTRRKETAQVPDMV